LYSPKTKLKVAAVDPWLYYCKKWVWEEGTDLAYVYFYENRSMKPGEIVFKTVGQRMKENDARDYSNQDLSITYVNVTLKYPVQLIYANKNIKLS
jgi:hypothetical protein